MALEGNTPCEPMASAPLRSRETALKCDSAEELMGELKEVAAQAHAHALQGAQGRAAGGGPAARASMARTSAARVVDVFSG